MGVRIELACEKAEIDEQWSFVKKKSNQRWLCGMPLIMQLTRYSHMYLC